MAGEEGREPEMTIAELRTHVDTRFAKIDGRFDAIDRRFNEVDRRFEALEQRMAHEHAETRRHFDVVAERLEAHLRLFAERGDADHQRIENHETRIRTLEKRRR